MTFTWTEIPSPEPGQRRWEVSGLSPEVEHVAIPAEAWADRKALYGLTTDDDALTHVMWEHYIRKNPTAPDSVIPAAVKANFDRVWGPGHKPARGLSMTPEETAAQAARFNAARQAQRPGGKP